MMLCFGKVLGGSHVEGLLRQATVKLIWKARLPFREFPPSTLESFEMF